MVRRRKRKRIASIEQQPKVMALAPNQSWSMDFVSDGFIDGRRLRCLNFVDDFTKEYLAIEVDTSLPGRRVVTVLERLAESRGLPRSVTVNNGPGFISKVPPHLAVLRYVVRVTLYSGS
jgi:putative transposase